MDITLTSKDKARFWSKVEKGGPSECWLWTRSVNTTGYPQFRRGSVKILAHRLSYFMANGAIPDGMLVLHNCPSGDNPRCVNPRHLWLGTQQQNVRDMDAKGRRARGDRSGSRLHPERLPRGENHTRAKLTEDAIRAIRRRAAQGESQTALSREFAVSTGRICDIVHVKAWRHVR